MPTRTPVSLIAWVLLLVVAFALGRWTNRSASSPDSQQIPAQAHPSGAETADAHPAPFPEPAVVPPRPLPSRAEQMTERARTLAEAARTISTPDAQTYAFFEGLELEDLAPVTAYIESMAPGNEQDVMFIMAVRRWAQLDGPAALAKADHFPALGTRNNARQAVYEAWGARDPASAFRRAFEESHDELRTRGVAAALLGAATTDPTQAVALWQSAPESFRESEAGAIAAAQIASGAYGTGKREAIQALVGGLPEGVLRTRLASTLAAEWGAHYPDEAVAWITQVMPEDPAREDAINGVFSSLVQKDPALAAVWAVDYPDERRRTGYIAAAIQEWVRSDAVAAETWVNEQASGPYLDGAGYAMAAHFMAKRDMTRSFSWIRRINLTEMRAELLGTLGRLWAKEKPEEFKDFLDSTSLNRAEVEMLLAKIPPAS